MAVSFLLIGQPDGDLGAHVLFAFNGQAIALAKGIPDAAVYVPQADMAELFSLFGFLGGLVQKVRHQLRRHTHAVIRNAQQHIPVFQVGGDIQQYAAMAALGL